MCFKTLELIHRLLEEEKQSAGEAYKQISNDLRIAKEAELNPERIAFLAEQKEKAYHRRVAAEEALDNFLDHNFS